MQGDLQQTSASGLVTTSDQKSDHSKEATIFPSENPEELCERLKIILQKINSRKNSSRLDDEFFATVDKLEENKSITSTQK